MNINNLGYYDNRVCFSKMQNKAKENELQTETSSVKQITWYPLTYGVETPLTMCWQSYVVLMVMLCLPLYSSALNHSENTYTIKFVLIGYFRSICNQNTSWCQWGRNRLRHTKLTKDSGFFSFKIEFSPFHKDILCLIILYHFKRFDVTLI